MHGIVVVSHRALAEELRLAKIRVPTGALDPASHHVIAPRHEISIMRGWRRQQHENFVANFGGAALIRIEAEDPFMLAFRDGTIAQFTKAVEWELHHPGTETLRDCSRAIGAAGIGQDDFVGPQDTRYSIRDFFGFIEGENIGGYLLHISTLLSPTAAHAITAARNMQDERLEGC